MGPEKERQGSYWPNIHLEWFNCEFGDLNSSQMENINISDYSCFERTENKMLEVYQYLNILSNFELPGNFLVIYFGKEIVSTTKEQLHI